MEIGWKFKRQSFSLLLVVAIALIGTGSFFRLANLDHKVYWYDEALSSLRVTGHTQGEFISQTFTGQVIPVSMIRQYQQLSAGKGLNDTAAALAGNAEHPPLYYFTARLWINWFGDSITAMRSFPAVISLFTFPCMYWLGRELFTSTAPTWMAIALLSVSPLHVLYAQEARQYSLWTVTILLSCAALLRAMRCKTAVSWGIYAITTALGLYTFLFTVLVMVGHGLYVGVIERFRISKTTLSYLTASMGAIAAFSPWIFLVIQRSETIQKVTTSAQQGKNWVSLVTNWVRDLGCVFIDIEYGRITSPIVLILVVFALYYLCRHAPLRIWLFILTLIGATIFTLILADLTLGWKLSSRARYLFPGYIGIQLAVAYLLSRFWFFSHPAHQKWWRGLTGGLILGGLISCILITQAQVWWNKETSRYNIDVATILNQTERPLLISDTSGLNPGQLLALSHLLNDNVSLILTRQSMGFPQIPTQFSNVFLFNLSETLKAELDERYTTKKLLGRADFWQLTETKRTETQV